MTESVQLGVDAIVPSFGDVLRGQGMPANAVVRDKVRSLVEESLRIFRSEARPRCVTREVQAGEFEDIFRGEGHNDAQAPLHSIWPRAESLALFALTVGHGVSRQITGFIESGHFALGSMLDTVASLGVENAVGLLERRAAAATTSAATNGAVALNYSPGYCGWHISAQRKVFQYLCPERIGITLNDSYLMTPLKSTTGVIVSGDRAIHVFDNGFHFCRTCKGLTCVERRQTLAFASHPAV